jgi:hypothetical protein
MYCKIDQKRQKCRETVIPLRLFTTSGCKAPQASQVDADSEREGLQVPPSLKELNMKRMNTANLTLCITIGMAALTGCKSINLAMPTPSAKDANMAMSAPLVEKRETITATGYAVVAVQNHKNPAQQRLMAIRASKLDAYRNLTEQVYGQQLDATSTVADMVVTNDVFRTKVEGVIYGARLVSITPVGDETYETTLSLDRDVVQDLRMLFMGQMAGRGR